uniref:thymidylate synthase n=1 Tax=viral metagenome TaxID=1070528 RepID=A0A6C0BSR8_9ZZZZ
MVNFNIVVSVNQNNIIGVNNDLLISSKDDLHNFYLITTNQYPEGPLNKVIMGYNTWLSLPDNVKPLKKRMNIVISKNNKDKIKQTETLKVFENLYHCYKWCEENNSGRNFIIGGGQLFEESLKSEFININIIYLTRFYDGYRYQFLDKKRDNVKFLPTNILDYTETISSKVYNLDCNVYTKERNYKTEKLETHFIIYQNKLNVNNEEKQYLDILLKILKQGTLTETRNGNTLSLFGEKMVFDMSKGFPLLTTKKMGYKTILRELLWFISGSTSNQKLKDKNVHIWDLNSTREFLDSRGLDYEEGDLGPVYGFQWRHSGAEYKDCNTNYKGQGVDQLQNIIDLIKNEPNSRRIIMNAWNPYDLDKMALPPCHVMCQFHVNTTDKTLDCQLYQRSGDMFLGVPFNIASYSFLLHIIAGITGYKPGKLIHILGDCHIYSEHISSVNEQLGRVPINFPKLKINENIFNKKIDDITEDIFQITNYKSYDKISAPMIA